MSILPFYHLPAPHKNNCFCPRMLPLACSPCMLPLVLPLELLCISLWYLDLRTLLIVIPRVCRRWRKACQALVGVHLDIHRLWMWREIPMEFIASLGALTDFKGCDKLTDEALIALADKCRGLTTVNFWGCDRLTDKGVLALADKCRGLTVVSFPHCSSLTNAAVIELADKCRGLKKIEVFGCWGVLDTAVIALADKCQQLTNADTPSVKDATLAAVRFKVPGCVWEVSVRFM